MTEHQSSRTLVKSAPELWAECSDAASLARHLGAFGEIRITKLEPETAVAWEGAAASGTVKLESSGWGTRVTLTLTEQEVPAELQAAEAQAFEPEPVEPEPDEPQPDEPEPDEPEPAHEPESVAVVPEAPRRPGRFARFRLPFRRRPEVIEPEPEPPEPAAAEPEPEPQPEPEPVAEPTPEPLSESPPAPEPAKLTGENALVAALDSLGMAHHRPYSRA
jgi:hypothetical protein